MIAVECCRNIFLSRVVMIRNFYTDREPFFARVSAQGRLEHIRYLSAVVLSKTRCNVARRPFLGVVPAKWCMRWKKKSHKFGMVAISASAYCLRCGRSHRPGVPGLLVMTLLHFGADANMGLPYFSWFPFVMVLVDGLFDHFFEFMDRATIFWLFSYGLVVVCWTKLTIFWFALQHVSTRMVWVQIFYNFIHMRISSHFLTVSWSSRSPSETTNQAFHSETAQKRKPEKGEILLLVRGRWWKMVTVPQ